MGNWLLVSLDTWSNRAAAQTFLRRTLTYDNHACELVYWHQPRWSSGEHGSDGRLAGIWRLAVRMGVDVVLNGHDHDYERFARLNASGAPAPPARASSSSAPAGWDSGASVTPSAGRRSGSGRSACSGWSWG